MATGKQILVDRFPWQKKSSVSVDEGEFCLETVKARMNRGPESVELTPEVTTFHHADAFPN